mgnify:CR=1 FL=1|tara:strand:- start:3921 stop:4133 length:213 start_codon:yes stop_codon:yes gene_type:complete
MKTETYKSTEYAKNRLELLKDEMGTIKDVYVLGNSISLEFENGMTIQLHKDEIKHQAMSYLESEIESVRN